MEPECYNVHKKRQIVSDLSQLNPVYIIKFCLINLYFNSFYHLQLDSPSGLLLIVFQTKFFISFIISLMPATCPVYRPIICGQVYKL